MHAQDPATPFAGQNALGLGLRRALSSQVRCANVRWMSEIPRLPRVKTPEDLAREQAERSEIDLIRARRWRVRRQWYWLVTVTAGMVLPAFSLAIAGAIYHGSFRGWLTTSGGMAFTLTALGGGLAAALVFVRSWGVSRGMLVFGGLFVGVLLTNRAEFGKLIAALPGLVAMFVVAGAAVGYVTTMEDDG